MFLCQSFLHLINNCCLRPCPFSSLQVQDGASTVFGPILERSAKAERIRSVQLLLRRFQGLFSAPQRITAHAAARDFEQVCAVLAGGSTAG
jgi:hypothetical protein